MNRFFVNVIFDNTFQDTPCNVELTSHLINFR